jgi:hypothetical protein
MLVGFSFCEVDYFITIKKTFLVKRSSLNKLKEISPHKRTHKHTHEHTRTHEHTVILTQFFQILAISVRTDVFRPNVTAPSYNGINA